MKNNRNSTAAVLALIVVTFMWIYDHNKINTELKNQRDYNDSLVKWQKKQIIQLK
jgi:hypothetical protein